MATIPLTDKFGLDIGAQPAPTSALLKYFQQLPSLHFDSLDMSKVGGLTLDQSAIQSLSTGLLVKEPVNLGAGAPTFCIGAGAHASIQLIQDLHDLPGSDGDQPEKPSDTCYCSFALDASVSPSLSIAAGDITLGASPSTKVQLASYSRFSPKTGVTLLRAIQETVAAFAAPLRSADLADLADGQITRATVSGKLELSGSVNLLATTNPLASASLPAPLPAAAVSAGGCVTIGVSCEIEADYEVVARKLDSGAVRLGWYRQTATEVAVHATASEGISAGFTGIDLFSKVVGAISASPEADIKELTGAGVPGEQAEAIHGAVHAAAARKLEIAVTSEISRRDSQAATFLYEIVPALLDIEGKQAIDKALRDDLSGLHSPGLAGISCVSSIWDTVCKNSVELDVNLLGILNYRSVATLSLAGKVLYEPATGALVITDQASAERINSTQVNFGADTQKLRHVLAESFLITAAYHGAGKVASAPVLNCRHCFFELQDSTSRSDMARKLRTGAAIGLLAGAEAAVPESVPNFGRTLFSVSTEFDGDMVTGMFLGAGDRPLPREQYEAAGRAAIRFLVQDGDDDAVRRRPAIDDALWNQMKDAGQPSFSRLFPGVPGPLIGAIAADYSTIQWWADAMFDTAHELALVRKWLSQNPNAGLQDASFQELREHLADYLRQVAANTREEFGQPWGLIAMNQLAGRNAGAKFLISGPNLTISKPTKQAAAIAS